MTVDDLISRKAAIEAVKISDDGCTNISARNGVIFARVEARRAIQNIPSVPAVPLDKLCEFLESGDCPSGHTSGDELCRKVKWDCRKCWHEILTKWMEEQDAAD